MVEKKKFMLQRWFSDEIICRALAKLQPHANVVGASNVGAICKVCVEKFKEIAEPCLRGGDTARRSISVSGMSEEVEGEARPSDIVQTNSPLMTIDLGLGMRDLGAPACMCIQCFASHSVVRLCQPS